MGDIAAWWQRGAPGASRAYRWWHSAMLLPSGCGALKGWPQKLADAGTDISRTL